MAQLDICFVFSSATQILVQRRLSDKDRWYVICLSFLFVCCFVSTNFVHSGKLPDNEVVMAHPSVSRSHALLVVDKTLGAFLIDLGASNGSFVDGRVSKQPPPPTALVHSHDPVLFL